MAVDCASKDEYIPCKEYQTKEYTPPVKLHFDHLFKIMLLGDSGVGKTSVITRFMEDEKSDNIATMTGGIEFKHVTFVVNDVKSDVKCSIKLQLWDCAGQPRFRALVRNHFRNKNAFLLFYDVTERTSFDNVAMWMSELKEVVTSPVVYLVANKCDCDAERRVVTSNEGEKIAKQLGVPYFETNARTGDDVAMLFTSMTKMLIDGFSKT